MTRITRELLVSSLPAESSPGPDCSAVEPLARLIRLDPDSGVLTIVNGHARISLFPDGTIRLDGTRVINSADEQIQMNAPRIDLN
jgi:hypothetical protein